MKQILFLFFTLCGINAAVAQDAEAVVHADSVKVIVGKKDSVLKKNCSLRLLTNPVKNKAELEVKGFDAGEVQLIMTDSRGSRVRDDRRLLFAGMDVITIMFSLPAGIYFITIKQRQKIITTRMLVR